MFRKIFLLLLVIVSVMDAQAQYTRYIVKFKDKGNSPFSFSNPSAFLSQRSLDRRTRHGISIDSTDLPVTPRYLDSIRTVNHVQILTVSKWLNQVAIQTTDPAAITRINQFPFVAATSPVAARMTSSNINKGFDNPVIDLTITPNTQRINGYYQYGQSNGQVTIHQGDFLHNHGFRGQQMQVAILDAGFFNYLNLPTFDSLRINNRVLGTWDFVANETSVNEDNSHGMHCLSTMAANLPGRFVGTSPEASFYLFRTEDVASEYPIEEHFWASGAERADSLGVDIVSVSLGYTEFDDASFNHTYAELNGRSTMIAKAANHAASRGMLVVVAAGNEGNGSWHYISTPADADDVLAVGAVDTLGRVAGFSGYGPNSSNQVKPDVAAVGWLAIVANGNTGQPAYSNGTSFACPNMAGIATCLWQAFPEMNNMTIRQALRESSTRYGNPDDRVGYGIPDAKKAFVLLQKRSYQSQTTISGCRYQLAFDLKTDNSMTIDLERKNSLDSVYQLIHRFENNASFSLQHYEFTDEASGLANTQNHYRMIVRIGTDTSYVLDSTVSGIPVCLPITGNDILVTPNPVSEVLTIQTRSLEPAAVQLVMYNAAGQKVRTFNFNQTGGNTISRFAIPDLSKGVYFLTAFFNDQKVKTVRLIIK